MKNKLFSGSPGDHGVESMITPADKTLPGDSSLPKPGNIPAAEFSKKEKTANYE
jgi:hypothetical protein